MESRPIAILGATGSIGTTTLQVVRAHPTLLRVAGLAAHKRWRELIGPVREFKVGAIALADPQAAAARQAALERVVRAALVHLPASKAAAVAAAATGATREQAYALAVRFAKAGTQAEQPAGD